MKAADDRRAVIRGGGSDRYVVDVVVPMSPDRVAAAGADRDRYRAMVIVQAALGLRIGELLALQVGDIDFLRRTVRIERQLAPGARDFAGPKTPSSTRTVPLPQVAAEALARHIEIYPPRESAGLLFCSRYGQPFRADWYGQGSSKLPCARLACPRARARMIFGTTVPVS